MDANTATKNPTLIIFLQSEFAQHEEHNERLFYACKQSLGVIKQKLQKTISNVDQNTATEKQISEELTSKGEEQKQQYLVGKSKLLSIMEADLKMQEKMDTTSDVVCNELKVSGKRMNNFFTLFTEYFLLKHQKMEEQ
jgi:hypothetical protein